MINQGVLKRRAFICCFGLQIISSFLVGATSSVAQDLASNNKAAQNSESESASSNLIKEIVKPPPIRNRRSNLFSENEPLYGSNADLNSAFLYNDEIMQNLLSSPPSKPLSYARSNFFLNYLKPRTTRYNAWDDHSLMHFGKRSLETDTENEKVLVKRSTDFWSPNNVLHFGKKSENSVKGDESPIDKFDVGTDDFDSKTKDNAKDTYISNSNAHEEYSQNYNKNMSPDTWHSVMNFDKKSQSPWDHNTMHFGKKDEPWHNIMSFGKRDEPWHSMMSFGKRDEPWHSMMSFGKRDEPWHNMMSFGKRDEPWHSMMSFGKREEPWHSMMSFGKRDEPWHSMMSFGKRDEPWHSMMSFGKRNEPWHNMMSFGKRDEPWNNVMSFGKRDEPWHNMMSFGKRDEPWHSMMSFGKREEPWHSMMSFGKRDEPWHSMMSFGKRDEPWHSMMSFGKRDEPWHSMMSFGKRDEPWHNMMSFGKKSDNLWDHNTLHFGKRDPWDHNTLHFGKRDDPWHNMMSFGKRSDNIWDHNTLHFGKRDDPWHNMMSFGKKSESSDMTDLEKREDPWHNMMSFGKKSDGLLNNNITVVDKRDELWHSMMSFGKKADYGFDHNTLHFGKRDEPWHNMMSFGKKSGSPWDHNTLHFGKKDEPWHSMMSFGKKFDPLAEKINFLLEREDYPSHKKINNEKRADGPMDDLSEDFSKHSDPWNEYDGMMFFKKSNPWDHNTLHFGKKSNTTWESESPTEKVNSNHVKKRSVDMWTNHNTMHFGKKFDPWGSHNTMHFGKKSDSLDSGAENDFGNNEEYKDISKIENIDKKLDWDSHNTMHFGKRDPEDSRNTFLFNKRNPWDYHNTMHFGKRDLWDNHNTMHFGKRNPWDYHNTMHFGKKDNWDYHNTMHFGKRNPLDYHNTMHFGKRSEPDLKDKSISNTDKSVDKSADKNSNMENIKGVLDIKADKKESSIKKRSSVDSESREESKNKHIIKETSDQASDNQKFLSQSKTIKQPLGKLKSTVSSKSKENKKSGITANSPITDHINVQQISDKKSHIQKRSVIPNSFIKSFDEDQNADVDLVDVYSKNAIADNVLHFGKRSIEVTDDNEDQWNINRENVKRFDDFWNDHNTLHFGKKSDPWDNHNTLHFGKRFDPSDNHATMHFGKRSDSWGHNVMHFGKKRALTPDEFQVMRSLDFDPVELNEYIQSLNTEEDNSSENNDFLDNIVILKSIINSRLKDDNIPFEERVGLLRHYLKPILKAIIDTEGSKFISFVEPNDNVNERIKYYNNGAEDAVGESTPFQSKNGFKYDDSILKKGNDDSSYGEYGDNMKNANPYSSDLQTHLKSKRKYLGKSELKRYFIPFQGPKSIVYPHAWYASQIRRSSLPRTTEYARHMEMRMAEKKEDPFNSYMHFGRR